MWVKNDLYQHNHYISLDKIKILSFHINTSTGFVFLYKYTRTILVYFSPNSKERVHRLYLWYWRYLRLHTKWSPQFAKEWYSGGNIFAIISTWNVYAFLFFLNRKSNVSIQSILLLFPTTTLWDPIVPQFTQASCFSKLLFVAYASEFTSFHHQFG